MDATGLKQVQLAERAGVLPSQFSGWMKGHQRPPRSRLQAWAKREGWPLEMFLEGGPMPSEVLKGPPATDTSDRVIRGRGAPYLGDASKRGKGTAGDSGVTQPADTPAPLSEVALMVAEKVARVIENYIRMDEAGTTRDGRAVLADALEDFARRCLQHRRGEDVAEVFDAATRLRRGEL